MTWKDTSGGVPELGSSRDSDDKGHAAIASSSLGLEYRSPSEVGREGCLPRSGVKHSIANAPLVIAGVLIPYAGDTSCYKGSPQSCWADG